MPRPPVKKTEKLARAHRLGELRAERQFHKSKSFQESAREHIGKFLDRLELDDIVELTAAVGLTFVVHDVILSTKALLDKVMRVVLAPKTLFDLAAASLNSANQTSAIISTLDVYLTAIHDWLPFFGGFVPTLGTQTVPLTGKVDMIGEILIWLISFSLAYMIIKQGGQIFGLLDKGLGTILELFLPTGA